MISNKIKKYFENILVVDEVEVWTFPQAKIENFSSCTFTWFNFDMITDLVYCKYYRKKTKSCDVLKLFDKRIDFIEIKTLDITEVRTFWSKIWKEYKLIKKLEASYELIKKIIENEKEFDNINDLDLLVKIQKLFCVAIYFKFNLDKDNWEQFAITQRCNIFKKHLSAYFIANPLPYWENFIDEPNLLSVNSIWSNIETIDDFYKRL